MKEKIYVFVIGLLLGGIIATGSLFVYQKCNENSADNTQSNEQMQMPGGNGDNSNGQMPGGNGGTPPAKPGESSSNSGDSSNSNNSSSNDNTPPAKPDDNSSTKSNDSTQNTKTSASNSI